MQQRLLSSIEAFARTLRVHRRTVERQHSVGQDSNPDNSKSQDRNPNPHLFDLLGSGVGSDDDRAELDPEALQREDDAQFEAATLVATTKPQDDEVRLLDEMTRIAEEARGLPDARVRCLLDIEQELRTEPERIAGVYVVKAQRIEPVGLIYLWPVTN